MFVVVGQTSAAPEQAGPASPSLPGGTSSSSRAIRRKPKPGKSNVSHTGKCIIIWALLSNYYVFAFCYCLGVTGYH